MTSENTADQSIAGLLSVIHDNQATYGDGRDGVTDTLTSLDTQLDVADELIGQYQQLLAAVNLRAYPVEPGTDDRLEQVVMTIHGVDVSIRGRTDDVYVNIDDERDDEDRRWYPLQVEVDTVTTV